jgi:hypothetical protein
MAIAVTDRIRRGESGNSPFAVAWQDDLKIAFVTVADITARDAIYEWKRLPYMTVYVIATNTEYTLGTDLTIAGQVWTEKSYGVPDNVVTEDELFDINGFIQPQLIQNIFLNTSYVVASEAAMLALTSFTGNFFIRTDTSEVYIKLNNDDPSDISDFALASGGSGVISVNGSTGVVSVTIASLLAVGANQTAFDAAVTVSPTVAANVGAILTLQSDVTTLQGDLADLDDYVQTHLGIQALSAIAQTPTGAEVGQSLIWDGVNYTLSLISGGGSGLADPMTTRGDLIFRNSSNVTARLPVGTATYVLTSDGTDVSWAAPSSSFTLVNGNGTTVNGTGDGVDLGGTLTNNVFIDGNYGFNLGNTTPLVSTTISVDDRIEFNVNNANGSGYLGFIAGSPGDAGFHMEIGDSDYQHIFDVSNTGALLEQTDQISADISTLYLHNTYSLLSFNSKRLKFETSGTTLNLGSDATGDTYYRNSSGYFTRLAAGTNGYVLTSQGSGSAPIWSSVGGSSAGINTEVQLSNGSGGFTAGGSTMASNVFSLGLTTNASVTQDITIKNSATTSHLRLLGRASGTSGIIGGQVSIISGAGNAAGVSHGGTINITGGNGGATTGNGGAINITSGSAVAGNYQGGLVSITGGLGNGTQSGGGVTITSGSSNGTGTGGTVSLIAGFGGATSGTGGNVNIYAGDANAGNSAGGSVVLRSGQSTGTQTAGSISLLAASSLGTTGAGGALYLYAGDGGSTSGVGGSIYFTAGNAAAGNSGGGIISLAGGSSSGTGIPGGINITGGDADTIHEGGDVLIAGGLGGNTSGAGGVVNIYGGYAAGGNSAGGAVTVLAGGAVGIGIGGLLNIIGGEGGDTSGAGGAVIIRGGPSLASTSASGAVTIGGGNTDSLTGEGGATTITTGNGGATSGNSGTLNISTGSIISGISGNININPNLLGVLNLSTTNTGAVNIGNATGIVTIGGVSVSLTATPATSASFSTATLLLRESGGGLTKVAASGGGTTNFLRADGTWAAPSGGGAWLLTGTSTLTGAVNVVGSATNKFKFTIPSLGTSVTDEFLIENNTAATSGNQQSSGLVLGGYGWKTTGTAASQSVKFQLLNTPVQGIANPSGIFSIKSSINGAAYGTDLFSVTSSGDGALGSLTLTSNRYISFSGGVGSLFYSGLSLAVNNSTTIISGGAVRMWNGQNFSATSGNQIHLGVEIPFAPTSGTATMTALNISGVINQTGGANGAIRGLYYNPTLTALGGTNRVIDATSGDINLEAGDVFVKGTGTGTGKALTVKDSGSNERFSVQHNGVINVNGSGGTAGQVLVSNGTSAAAWAAGGIGGSTGATDNSILRADGTGGATLQNSGLFIDDSANLTIGTVSLSGNKTISAVNSTSDANLTLTSQGTVVVDVASAAESFQVMTTNDRVIINPAGFQLFGEKINASANATFLVSGAQGITGATTGQNLLLQAGSGYATGVTNGGHLYLMYGVKNSTGTDGNIGLLTSSVANWQSMERGVYLGNRLTAPTTGIANGVALFAEDSNSLSEFYVMPESGAKVNISGLFEPVTESGTLIYPK